MRVAIWYYNVSYILFTYVASFIGYEDDILEVISNLYVLGAKFGGEKDKFSGKSFKKLNSAEFMELVFSKYAYDIWYLTFEFDIDIYLTYDV